jgi:phosphate:Na+ symporter
MIQTMLINLVGGVCLLLYGLQLAGEGLQGVAGTRLRGLLSSVTKNRFLGVGAGAAITAIIQSSSATTVMLVGFTSAGLLTLHQTIAIILGADIGTTLTVQLLAFPILDYSLLIVGAGFLIYFMAKRRPTKFTGMAILGFGFLFLGLKTLTQGMSHLKEISWFPDLMLNVEDYPFWSLVLSAVITALLQSSAATIGISLAFASQGLMTLQASIPIILGANVGTCAAALISSIGAPAEAKRVAIAHTLFKIMGVVLFYPFLGPYADLTAYTAHSLPRQIANAHTLFNVVITGLILPFSTPLANLVTRLVKDPPKTEDPAHPRYLDPHVLDSPPLALGQATREAIRMADIVQGMYKNTITVFTRDNPELIDDIETRENWVDNLNREIKLYLTKLSQSALNQEQLQREMALLAAINDLENIGDIIDKNLMELARKKIYKGLRFSEQGLKEIVDLHQMVGQNFEGVITAFASQDPELAQRVIKSKGWVAQKERELRQAHIRRLHEGLPESIETSAIHLDVLTNLKRINSHITNIAYPIAEQT